LVTLIVDDPHAFCGRPDHDSLVTLCALYGFGRGIAADSGQCGDCFGGQIRIRAEFHYFFQLADGCLAPKLTQDPGCQHLTIGEGVSQGGNQLAFIALPIEVRQRSAASRTLSGTRLHLTPAVGAEEGDHR